MNFLKWLFSGNTTREIKSPVDLQKTFDLTPREDTGVFGITDVGIVRDHNEDYFVINDDLKLYIVADGMGGHNAGERASEEAVTFILNYLSAEKLKKTGNKEALLNDAVMKAHEHIIEVAQTNPDYNGMGCTIVIAYLADHNLHSCHVGDARIYIISETEIKQIGHDHSVVAEAVKAGQMTSEEARLSPLKNQITMAIGGSTAVVPEYYQQEVHASERVVLCSDGLWDMMPDERIKEIAMKSSDAESVTRELLKCALDEGGHDNVTIVTVMI